MEHICIFCDKETKYIKGTKTREELMQSLELRSDEKVRQASANKCDSKILAKTSRELVAAEAHYHKSCYRNYTREEKPKTETLSLSHEDEAYQLAEQNSYKMLFKHIRDSMFIASQAVRLSELTEKLTEFLKSNGCSDIKKQTKNHIRRKLTAEFEESLHFISEINGKLIVYPDNLSITQVIRDNMKLKDKVKELTTTNDMMHNIKQSAIYFRDKIKSMTIMTWPPNIDDLDGDYIKLPETLQLFLRKLLFNDLTGAQCQRVVQSIGQDCVYAVSGGSIVPAKHILLPWGVKSLTGNIEVC
jgi:hypothetical protein